MSEDTKIYSGNSVPPRSAWIRPTVILLTMMAICGCLMFALFNIPQEYYFTILLFGTLPMAHWITKWLTGVNFEKEYLSKWIDKLIN